MLETEHEPSLRVFAVDCDLIDTSELDALTDPSERAAAARYSLLEHRREVLVSRALVRWALSHVQPEVLPRSWAFSRTDAGRPLVVGHDVWFSLSRGRGFVACVVTSDATHSALGIDVEPLETFSSPSTSAVFSAAERQRLERHPEDAAFLWTLKEAYLKARGEGISVKPARVSLKLAARGAEGIRRGAFDYDNLDQDAASWWLGSGSLPTGSPSITHALSVAVKCERCAHSGARIVVETGLFPSV